MDGVDVCLFCGNGAVFEGGAGYEVLRLVCVD